MIPVFIFQWIIHLSKMGNAGFSTWNVDADRKVWVWEKRSETRISLTGFICHIGGCHFGGNVLLRFNWSVAVRLVNPAAHVDQALQKFTTLSICDTLRRAAVMVTPSNCYLSSRCSLAGTRILAAVCTRNESATYHYCACAKMWACVVATGVRPVKIYKCTNVVTMYKIEMEICCN